MTIYFEDGGKFDCSVIHIQGDKIVADEYAYFDIQEVDYISAI